MINFVEGGGELWISHSPVETETEELKGEAELETRAGGGKGDCWVREEKEREEGKYALYCHL